MTADLVTCPDGHGTQDVIHREFKNGGTWVILACGYNGPFNPLTMGPPAAIEAGNDLTVVGQYDGDAGE